jgi:hypothetical protein
VLKGKFIAVKLKNLKSFLTEHLEEIEKEGQIKCKCSWMAAIIKVLE